MLKRFLKAMIRVGSAASFVCLMLLVLGWTLSYGQEWSLVVHRYIRLNAAAGTDDNLRQRKTDWISIHTGRVWWAHQDGEVKPNYSGQPWVLAWNSGSNKDADVWHLSVGRNDSGGFDALGLSWRPYKTGTWDIRVPCLFVLIPLLILPSLTILKYFRENIRGFPISPPEGKNEK